MGSSSHIGALLPRLVGGGPTFSRCNFSGLTTHSLKTWDARFFDCDFSNVTVKLGLGTARNEMVGCRFSGVWDGNLSAGERGRKVRVESNDFTQVTGIGFMDGVDWRKNSFDIGGRHLVLTVAALNSETIPPLCSEDPLLALCVASLRGNGPLHFGQDWTLLHRGDHEATVWAALVNLLT